MSMIVLKPAVGSAAALKLVQWSVEHAQAHGWEVCAAVCDPAGHLVALLRTDGVDVAPISFAIDKAFTAATMRRATTDLFARAEEEPALKLGLANRPRLLVFPGGLPIEHEGVVVGGLGVSGAAGHEDVECATAALARLAREG